MIHIQQQVWITKESFEDKDLAEKELALLNDLFVSGQSHATYRLIKDETIN